MILLAWASWEWYHLQLSYKCALTMIRQARAPWEFNLKFSACKSTLITLQFAIFHTGWKHATFWNSEKTWKKLKPWNFLLRRTFAFFSLFNFCWEEHLYVFSFFNFCWEEHLNIFSLFWYCSKNFKKHHFDNFLEATPNIKPKPQRLGSCLAARSMPAVPSNFESNLNPIIGSLYNKSKMS